jgi:hypothetical protein
MRRIEEKKGEEKEKLEMPGHVNTLSNPASVRLFARVGRGKRQGGTREEPLTQPCTNGYNLHKTIQAALTGARERFWHSSENIPDFSQLSETLNLSPWQSPCNNLLPKDYGLAAPSISRKGGEPREVRCENCLVLLRLVFGVHCLLSR